MTGNNYTIIYVDLLSEAGTRAFIASNACILFDRPNI